MTTLTKYTYFVSQDFLNKQVNKNELTTEINKSAIVTKLNRIDVIGNICEIWFVNSLSLTDNNILSALIASHVGIESVQTVEVKEETVPTGGYFKVGMFEINAPRNTTTTQEFSFDYPVNIITARLITSSEHSGDYLTWQVRPDTIVGTLIHDHVAETTWTVRNYVVNNLVWYQAPNTTHGRIYKCIRNTVSNEAPSNSVYWTKQNTVLHVSNTVTANVKIGFNINLTDGLNINNVGDVIAIDATAGTITVNGAPQHNYNDTSPTYVRISVVYMDNVKLGHAMNFPIGESKIGASYVPTGTIIRSKYTNNSPSVDKTLLVYLEYLY